MVEDDVEILRIMEGSRGCIERLRRIEGIILCRGTEESGRENEDGEELRRAKGRR